MGLAYSIVKKSQATLDATRQFAVLLTKTRAHLLLRWPRSAAQIEYSFSSGVPLFNTFFLNIL